MQAGLIHVLFIPYTGSSCVKLYGNKSKIYIASTEFQNYIHNGHIKKLIVLDFFYFVAYTLMVLMQPDPGNLRVTVSFITVYTVYVSIQLIDSCHNCSLRLSLC